MTTFMNEKREKLRRGQMTLVMGGFIAAVLPLTPARTNEVTVAQGRAIVVNGVSTERPGCSSCHLQNGAGQPDVGIPRLTGLTLSYITAQLGYFATGARQDTAMAPYAAALTLGQRQAVADYFASLPVLAQAGLSSTSPARLNRGRALFLNGDYRTGLLSCSQCHGPTGLGVGDYSPRLAGQSAAYVAEQLLQWQSGELRDPDGAFMRAEASRLTRSDIEAVAVFVESLENGEADKQ